MTKKIEGTQKLHNNSFVQSCTERITEQVGKVSAICYNNDTASDEYLDNDDFHVDTHFNEVAD